MSANTVSIPPSGHPSFRQFKLVVDLDAEEGFHPAFGPPLIQTHKFLADGTDPLLFPSRLRATPHSDLSLLATMISRLLSFHPAFGPPLIQTGRAVRRGTKGLQCFHPAFGPPLIQTHTLLLVNWLNKRFPSRLRATPHSDLGSFHDDTGEMIVSIPPSGHPSFRPLKELRQQARDALFPSRLRATPHSDMNMHK